MDRDDEDPEADTSAGGKYRWLPAAFVAAMALLGLVFLRDALTFETLGRNRNVLLGWRDAQYPLAVIAYMGFYITVVAFSLPGAAVITLTGGFLFGLFPGAAFVVLSATIGAVLIFLVARLGFGDALARRLSDAPGLVGRMHAGLKDNEISFLLLMRLMPAMPFFAANLVPALAGASLRNFAVTTFFGIMPASLVFTWVGSGLGEVFDRGETPGFGTIWQWPVLGPILALCALSALPIVLKARR